MVDGDTLVINFGTKCLMYYYSRLVSIALIQTRGLRQALSLSTTFFFISRSLNQLADEVVAFFARMKL